MSEKTATIEKIYMSPTEAAERYSLSLTGIYRILGLPDAPKCLKIGQRRLIPIKQFDAYIETLSTEGDNNGI